MSTPPPPHVLQPPWSNSIFAFVVNLIEISFKYNQHVLIIGSFGELSVIKYVLPPVAYPLNLKGDTCMTLNRPTGADHLQCDAGDVCLFLKRYEKESVQLPWNPNSGILGFQGRAS